MNREFFQLKIFSLKQRFNQLTFVLITTLLLSLSLSGCMFVDSYEEELHRGVLNHLKERYNKNFVILRVIPASNPFTGKPFDRVFVQDPSTNKEFLVTRHQKNGEYRFEDGYSFHLAVEHINSLLNHSLPQYEPNINIALKFVSNNNTTFYEYEHPNQFDFEAFKLAEGHAHSVAIGIGIPGRREISTTEAARLYPLVKEIHEVIDPIPWVLRVWYSGEDTVSINANELLELTAEELSTKHPNIELGVLWSMSYDSDDWSVERIMDQQLEHEKNKYYK